MQTYVYIDNLRGFTDAVIPIHQVNFLVGENSTGKTSFLELIETFSDMSFWVLEPRHGVQGSQPKHFLDLVSASGKSKTSFIVGTVEMGEDGKTENNVGMIVTFSNLDGRPVPSKISTIQGSVLRTVEGRFWSLRKGDKYKAGSRPLEIDKNAERHVRCVRKAVALHKATASLPEQEVTSEQEDRPMLLAFRDYLYNPTEKPSRVVRAPFPFMSSLVEIAPIRSRPRRTYDAPQTTFSPEGEHTPYVIRRRLTNKAQSEAFQEFLDNAGKNSGLFRSLRVKAYGKESRAPFEIEVVLGKSKLGLENVGYGVSQALPILVELFVRPKRASFTIQQPEVHLHPKAQAAFGDLIATLARLDSKVFFVETHSDFMIDRFRVNVRKNGAIPGQILFFERTEIGNVSHSIDIQENGDLPSEQPAGYRSFFVHESLSVIG